MDKSYCSFMFEHGYFQNEETVRSQYT